MARFPMAAVALVLSAVLSLVSGTAASEFLTLDDTATYRKRIAVPDGAVLEVELCNVSRQAAPAPPLASIAIRAESVPVPFRMLYDPAMIDERHNYAVTGVGAGGDGVVAGESRRSWISNPRCRRERRQRGFELRLDLASGARTAPDEG